MKRRRRLKTPLEKEIEKLERSPATLDSLLRLMCLEEMQREREKRKAAHKAKTAPREGRGVKPSGDVG